MKEEEFSCFCREKKSSCSCSRNLSRSRCNDESISLSLERDYVQHEV